MPLPLMAAQLERFYGADWFYSPARWGTADGHVPFRIAIDGWRTMQSILAAERLSMIRAVSLSQPRQESAQSAWQRTIETEVALAFPREAD